MSKKRGRTLTLGVIIGFFIGLFLAPKKGTELRQDAKKKIDTIKENPKDVLHETFEDVKGEQAPENSNNGVANCEFLTFALMSTKCCLLFTFSTQ